MPVSSDLNEYQNNIRPLYTFDETDQLAYCIANLPGEVGELTGIFAKHIRDFKIPELTPEMFTAEGMELFKAHADRNEDNWNNVVIPKARKELGDCLFMVACFADALGMDLSELAEENLAKLWDRKDRGVIAGSGDDR